MRERLRRLWESIGSPDLDGLLINDILNVRYLSGFTGSYGVLLVTREPTFLLTDSRYTEQAAEEAPDCAAELVTEGWLTPAKRLVEDLSLRRVGFEKRSLNYQEWVDLASALPSIELVPIDSPVDQLRQVKDDSEIAALREAIRITDLAFARIAEVMIPGMTEQDVSLEIDYAMRKSGADKEGFDTIVAAGPRAALPHAKPTSRPIPEGELIVMDFGARWHGYHGDITRTVLLGKPDLRQQEVYDVVLDAQLKAIDAIKPGMPGKAIDAIARDYITSKGYGDYFGHGLGHGLGLAVHDGRIFTRFTDVILEPGMVATVEPGIYLPGWGGVRTEDDVLITDTGCEVLTRSPKTLILR